MSRDFTSQGLGNLVGSFFQGLPTGGSLSRTGVNASGGAMSRWSGGNSVVIMRLRGRRFHSLTWIEWFEEYNKKLKTHGNKLMLEGADEELMGVLRVSGLLEEIGEENVFTDHPKRGEALEAARNEGWEWINKRKT